MSLKNFKDRLVIEELPAPSFNETNFKFSFKKIKLDSEKASIKLNKAGKYKPNPKDKLYFYSDCNVPRYKVRDWALKNDSAVTIKPDNATASFCTDNILDQYTDDFNGTTLYYKTPFIAWIKNNFNVTKGNIPELMSVLEDPNLDENIFVKREGRDNRLYTLVSTYYVKDLNSFGYKTSFMDHHNVYLNSYCYCKFLSDEDYLLLCNLENNKHIYHQDDIITLINEDSTIIDSDMYNNLRTMFNSKNKADNVLALEIVANCNIQLSLHHVMLLLKEFKDLICNLKESNHINFKSLLEYIGFEKRDLYRIDEDIIIKCLMDKYLLTMPILKECAEAVKYMWTRERRSDFFKVESITVTDQVKDYFSKLAQIEN